MTKPQSQTKNDRQAPGGRQSDDATATVTEIPAAAAAATVEAVREGAEEAEAVTSAVRHWVGELFGLPIKMLAGGDVTPATSGRVWLDGTFEAIAALLTVQRRSVDRFLASQHRIAAQLIDSGWALTPAIGGLGLRGRAGETEDPQR